MNSCLIIAGEKSGEDHAMTFLPELLKRVPDCQFYGVGGDRLNAKGVELLYHLNDFSGIGISEVLSKIPFYYRALDHILFEVDKRNTKTAILIDFQGFNLKLAKKLKRRNVEVLYYVAPQAWVWKPWRSKVLEKNVNTLFTILPFEKNWFKKRGVSKVKSVVHPLMVEYSEAIPNITKRNFSNLSQRKPRILLLPGSRNTEVSVLFPIFEGGIKILLEEKFDIEIGIVKSESVKSENYETTLDIDKTWSSSELAMALNWSDMCVAASGTVTLATGLFEVPTVVCYQVSFVTEFLLNIFMTYKGPISLTNIIHEEYVFPEFIQYHADRYNISKSLRKWLQEEQAYNEVVTKLATTKEKLTGDDFNIAEYIEQIIKEGKS